MRKNSSTGNILENTEFKSSKISQIRDRFALRPCTARISDSKKHLKFGNLLANNTNSDYSYSFITDNNPQSITKTKTELYDNVMHLKKQLHQLSAEIIHAKSKFRKKENELNEKRRQIDDYFSDGISYKENIPNVDKMKDGNVISLLKKEYYDLKELIATKSKENSQIENIIKNNKLKNNLEDNLYKENQLKDLIFQYKALQLENVQSKMNIKNMENNKIIFAENHTKITELKKLLDKKEEECDALKEKIYLIGEDDVRADETLHKQDLNKNKLTKQIESLLNTKKSKEFNLKQQNMMNIKIENLKKTADKYKEKCDGYNNNIKDYENTIKILKKEGKKNKHQLEAFDYKQIKIIEKDPLEKCSSKIQLLQSLLNESRQRIIKLNENVEQYKQILAELGFDSSVVSEDSFADDDEQLEEVKEDNDEEKTKQDNFNKEEEKKDIGEINLTDKNIENISSIRRIDDKSSLVRGEGESGVGIQINDNRLSEMKEEKKNNGEDYFEKKEEKNEEKVEIDIPVDKKKLDEIEKPEIPKNDLAEKDKEMELVEQKISKTDINNKPNPLGMPQIHEEENDRNRDIKSAKTTYKNNDSTQQEVAKSAAQSTSKEKNDLIKEELGEQLKAYPLSNEDFTEFTYILIKNFEAKKINEDIAREKIILGINTKKLDNETFINHLSFNILKAINCQNKESESILKKWIETLLLICNEDQVKTNEHFLTLFNNTQVYTPDKELLLSKKVKKYLIKYKDQLYEKLNTYKDGYITFIDLKNVLDELNVKMKEEYSQYMLYEMKKIDSAEPSLNDLKIQNLYQLLEDNQNDSKMDTESDIEITNEEYIQIITNFIMQFVGYLNKNKMTVKEALDGIIQPITTEGKDKIEVAFIEPFIQRLKEIGIEINSEVEIYCLFSRYKLSDEYEVINVNLLEDEIKNLNQMRKETEKGQQLMEKVQEENEDNASNC